MDFIVLDTKLVANPTKMIVVILSRPFLATANANMNYRIGIMNIRFGNLKVKLNIFHTFQQPPDKAECFFLNSVENLVMGTMVDRILMIPCKVKSEEDQRSNARIGAIHLG
jgi:hypothetical protein